MHCASGGWPDQAAGQGASIASMAPHGMLGLSSTRIDSLEQETDREHETEQSRHDGDEWPEMGASQGRSLRDQVAPNSSVLRGGANVGDDAEDDHRDSEILEEAALPSCREQKLGALEHEAEPAEPCAGSNPRQQGALVGLLEPKVGRVLVAHESMMGWFGAKVT